MAAFSYVLSLRAMAQMAGVLGHHNATARYDNLAAAATAEDRAKNSSGAGGGVPLASSPMNLRA